MQQLQSQSPSNFVFPDIPWQSYPIYSRSKSGRRYNFKNIIYPNQKSEKKFTRRKQLKKRSLQAKIFDAIINIGYFDPLVVVKEFPILIDHTKHLDLEGGFFLLDYFIPNLRDENSWGLDIELDSEYHSPEKDKIRDDYLKLLNIKIFRISHLEKPSVQKTQFKQLTELMRTMKRTESPRVFTFTSL